jgi:hypothetical protein
MAYTTINKGADYFNTVLYTGTGATHNITGVGFQPDWVWIKHRNNPTAYNHRLYDSVRGATKNIASNETDAEITSSTELTSFDSDGFTLGSGNPANQNTVNHVAWNWLGANASSSNTDGSITSSVSANTTAGFSIVSYTGNNTAGATVGHGLSQEPDVMIFKNRSDGTTAWCVYHSAKGTSGTGRLNATNAFGDTTFITTTPSSSVFTLTNTTIVNGSSNSIIAYCFAEKKGFSKFGSYTGNGSTDGTFVYTGFKPAFVIQKRYSSIGSWYLWDNVREPSNVVTKRLVANTTAAEASNYNTLDFLSNGFKFRDTNNEWNGSGDSYIYMAFAEHPFVSSTGTPVTAR